ncbi:TetR/AcrR family transcriptional regulator [Curtobacterium sp. VKM Ac-2922]|uniref:TetR/AcrR family transcriptional regulator n=1 Tax=Curtobacterium sp. VKM Ac-2922 TaxID=2929475 RepID=UPI001FB534CD|nr:TetR/AcrR family transcriptional regulator [Curtobacterium sp. VKM Ac-2922]MCJ1712861.1 TetR/AcrR family transcriptional regulator [Curtobacterium sp. VKM Ac-2922]
MSEIPRTRAERVEVRRSREAILAAAEAHYAVKDTDPSMVQLAQLAGVGVATLYRRYASVDDVIRELHARLLGHFTRVETLVAARPTAWEAVVALVTGIIDVLQEHPAIPQLNRKMVALENNDRFTSTWNDQLDALIRAAQTEGTLRSDVTANDVTFAAFRIGSYANLPPDDAGRIIGRQVGIVLDGLRADGSRHPLPGDPITMQELQRIFRHEVDHPVE